MQLSHRSAALVLLLVLGGLSHAASAGMITITIDTTSLSGTDAALAFDLVRGDAVDNSVSILDFSTDGVLGGTSASGGPVSGMLPGSVTLNDEDFFNELLQDIVLANTIAFTLSFTQNFLAPTPSAFSLFLLDATGLPLFATSDPTGSNALFALDIDGTEFGSYSVFAPIGPGGATLTATPFTPNPTPVPEPGPLPLFVTALGMLVALSMRKLRSRRSAARA
jgi:hypothetical protein